MTEVKSKMGYGLAIISIVALFMYINMEPYQVERLHSSIQALFNG